MNTSILRFFKKKSTPYLFLFPTLLLLGVFLVYPLFASFYLSFTNYNIIQAPVFSGLSNYVRMIHDPVFWMALKNTVMYSLIVIPGLIIFSLFLAILVNKPIKGMNFFRAMIYIPVITAMPVVGIAWKILYSEEGIINGILQYLHITHKAIPFLSLTDIALFSICFVTIWKAAGYYMIIYLGGLQSIPVELEEAAIIDGANRWQIFSKITLPLLKPTLLLVTIVASVGAMKVFGEIYVMTSGGPANSTTTLVYYMYDKAFNFLDMGYASSMAVVLFILLLGFSILNLKMYEEKER